MNTKLLPRDAFADEQSYITYCRQVREMEVKSRIRKGPYTVTRTKTKDLVATARCAVYHCHACITPDSGEIARGDNVMSVKAVAVEHVRATGHKVEVEWVQVCVYTSAENKDGEA